MKIKNQSSFPSKYRLFILIAVCVILLGIGSVVDSSGPLRFVASYTVIPFQKGISYAGQWMSDVSANFQTMEEMRSENESLQSKVDELTIDNTRLRQEQYELERLIESGLLIGKHRVGTFTNPNSEFFWHASNGEPQPFVGVTYGSGDYFTYSYTASLSIAAIYRQLAESGCTLHDLRLLRKTPETIFEEIAPLHLDALVWAITELMRDGRRFVLA